MDKIAPRQKVSRFPLLKYDYIGSFPCNLVPNLSNNTFIIINTQPTSLLGEDNECKISSGTLFCHFL